MQEGEETRQNGKDQKVIKKKKSYFFFKRTYCTGHKQVLERPSKEEMLCVLREDWGRTTGKILPAEDGKLSRGTALNEGDGQQLTHRGEETSGMHKEGGKSIFKAVRFPRGKEERW